MSRFSPIRIVRSAIQFAGQILRLAGLAGSPVAFVQLATDHTRARLSYLTGRALNNRRRTVRLRGGHHITYRLNRGDVQSIREVLAEECYRLTRGPAPTNLLDLGANIGLSSFWYWKRYRLAKVVAVEADADNAELVRINLETNGVPATVVRAAIASHDGTVRFARHAESNLGGITEGEGIEIPAVSVATLLDRHWPDGSPIDLVKLDIEGGEKPLLDANTGWLIRVNSLIAELHFDAAGNRAVAERIAAGGLTYYPASPGNMDFFLRESRAV